MSQLPVPNMLVDLKGKCIRLREIEQKKQMCDDSGFKFPICIMNEVLLRGLRKSEIPPSDIPSIFRSRFSPLVTFNTVSYQLSTQVL